MQESFRLCVSYWYSVINFAQTKKGLCSALCGASSLTHALRVFLNHMNLQVVKFHGFYKIVLCEAGFFMTLKIRYIFVKPDRFAQIELTADFVQGVKYLVGAGISAFISNTGVLKHVVILENFCPKPKHILPCLSIDSQISFMVIDLSAESKFFLY